MEEFTPKVVCFSCDFSWGYLTGREKLRSQIDNWVPLKCSARAEATRIFKTFKRGADGVLILGYAEGHCHFQD